jgi:hypothetical protein
MARDLDTGIVKPTPVIVDEQTKAAGMRAAAAAAPAAATAIAKTPDQLLLEKAQATLADKQAQLAELYKSQGLNPDGSKKTATQTLQEKQTATAAERAALEGKDPLFNKAAGAPNAPEGYEYTWIGGTTTGQWKLYKLPDNTQGTGSGGSGSSGSGGSGATIKYDANGKPIVTDTNPITSDTRDAFAALTDLFKSYGLDSLAGEIVGYMTSGLTASEALIKLKTNPSGAYAERFAGNFARQKKGLNVMSESAYIELESSYAETLKAYGLGNMLSTDPKTNWKQFSTYIENDISAPEFKDRIKTVEDRVVNADASIKATFKQFYPSLTDQDLVAYFLNPTETIDKLKEKVTSAEIGAAFLGQGLAYTQASATELAKYGIDRAGALQGAADIKSVLPTSEKLSNIYGEAGINYNQKSGEAEFLKSNQDAADQRKRLKSMERASFQGDSGVSQQYGSLAKNIQGSF